MAAAASTSCVVALSFGRPGGRPAKAPRAAGRAKPYVVACSCREEQPNAPAASPRRALVGAMVATTVFGAAAPLWSSAEDFEPMAALKGKDYGKSRMRFEDFTLTSTGLQYKDMKEGNGEPVQVGDSVTIDWDGYTIGYYGRPFEARNKSKGGAFTGDNKDFLRYKVGEGQVIPAFEEATVGMKVGGIRRLVVPVELGYPDNDMRKLQPKPTTFSGKRALGFVLENQGMIDKTLLFDIELIRVNK